jgi:hypothetical protein
MTIDREDIEQKALGPKEAETDEGRIHERGIDDVIKADQYTSSKSALDGAPFGLRITRLKPGSSNAS